MIITYLPVPSVHVLLDPLSNAVYFYTPMGTPISSVELPGAPIDYIQLQQTNTVTGQTDDLFVVLANTGQLYLIQADQIIRESESLGTAVYVDWIYNDLSYENDIALSGSFTSIIRAQQQAELKPSVTSFSYDGQYLWVAGPGSIWKLNLDFLIIKEIAVPARVNNIRAHDGKVFFITITNQAYTLDSNEQPILVYTSECLGDLEFYNTDLYITDSNQHRLVKVNTATLDYSFIEIADFSPATLKTDATKLYVTGYDNNLVYDLDQNAVLSYTEFDAWVAWVSVVQGNIIASYWLDGYQLLDSGIGRIVPVDLEPRTGTKTHIGTQPVKIKSLGNAELTIFAPSDINCWVNGALGNVISTGNWLGVSFRATAAGQYRRPVVLGDRAFDYNITVIDSTASPRHIEFGITQLTSAQTQLQKSFIVAPHISNLTAAISYGYLMVNGNKYTGTVGINTGDQVDIFIPIASDQQYLAPIFTLGYRQFAIPIVPASDSLVVSELFEHNDVGLTDLVEDNISITLAGTYTIPLYYKPNDLLSFFKNDQLILNYQEVFEVGDVLSVRNISSSGKLIDARDLYVLGPINFHILVNSAAAVPVSFLTFDTLIEPFVRLPDPYISNTKSINGIGDTIALLRLEDLNSFFILNGQKQSSSIAVSINDNIAVGRVMQNYFADDLSVWQDTEIDGTVASSAIVGTWPVINIVATPEIYHDFGGSFQANNPLIVPVENSIAATTVEKLEVNISQIDTAQYNHGLDFSSTIAAITAAHEDLTRATAARNDASRAKYTAQVDSTIVASIGNLLPSQLSKQPAAWGDVELIKYQVDLASAAVLDRSDKSLNYFPNIIWQHLDENKELLFNDLQGELAGIESIVGMLLPSSVDYQKTLVLTAQVPAAEIPNNENRKLLLADILDPAIKFYFGITPEQRTLHQTTLSIENIASITSPETLTNFENIPEVLIDTPWHNILVEYNIFLQSIEMNSYTEVQNLKNFSEYFTPLPVQKFYQDNYWPALNQIAQSLPGIEHQVALSWELVWRRLLVTGQLVFIPTEQRLTVTGQLIFVPNEQHLLTTVTKEFAADEPNLVVLHDISINKAANDSQALRQPLFAIHDTERVWTQIKLDQYGAFLTTEQASAAGAVTGYLQVIPVAVYNTDYFSYRVLFDNSFICSVPEEQLYAMAWLIRGG